MADIDELVRNLKSDSRRFRDSGRDYDLLNLFLDGEPVELLIPLIKSSDLDVVRTAIWIAAELGNAIEPVEVLACSLRRHPDVYIRFYALDVIALSSITPRGYADVMLEALSDADERIRIHAMMLLYRTSEEHWEATRLVARSATTNERIAKKILAIDNARSGSALRDQGDVQCEGGDQDINQFLMDLRAIASARRRRSNRKTGQA